MEDAVPIKPLQPGPKGIRKLMGILEILGLWKFIITSISPERNWISAWVIQALNKP